MPALHIEQEDTPEVRRIFNCTCLQTVSSLLHPVGCHWPSRYCSKSKPKSRERRGPLDEVQRNTTRMLDRGRASVVLGLHQWHGVPQSDSHLDRKRRPDALAQEIRAIGLGWRLACRVFESFICWWSVC